MDIIQNETQSEKKRTLKMGKESMSCGAIPSGLIIADHFHITDSDYQESTETTTGLHILGSVVMEHFFIHVPDQANRKQETAPVSMGANKELLPASTYYH